MHLKANIGFARRMLICWSASACLLGASANAAGVLGDSIFGDSAEASVRLSGQAFASAPLANAQIEARVAARSFLSVADAQGNYLIAVSTAADPGAIIEVFAYGQGAQSAVGWRTALGPIAEAQVRAGSDGLLVRGEDPFVDLTPRTTAIAAALQRAGGGTMPIGSAAFHRATRAIQFWYTDELAAALMLIAEGVLSLPVGMATTLDAVDSLADLQALYALVIDAGQGVNCTTIPEPDYCRVTRRLRTGDDLMPAIAASTAGPLITYFGWSSVSAASPAVRFAPDLLSADYWPSQGILVEDIPLTSAAGVWPIRVGHADQRTLTATEDFPFNATVGTQVRRVREVYAFHYRFTRAPAGQLLASIGQSVRNTYPDHPVLPTEDFPVTNAGAIAQSVDDGSLPASLRGGVPNVSGRRFLIPIARALTPGGALVLEYDFATFDGVGNAQIERSGVSAAYTQASSGAPMPGSILLSIAGSPIVEMQLTMINEERPGIWRVGVAAQRSGSATTETFGTALLMAALPISEGFNAANAPGRYGSLLNGHLCDGPLGEIEALVPTEQLPFCFPLFGYVFNAGGSGGSLAPATNPVAWTLPGGLDLGRLRLDRFNASGTTVTSRRGWEVVGRAGNRLMVLENAAFGPPNPPLAPTFAPSTRLGIYILLP